MERAIPAIAIEPTPPAYRRAKRALDLVVAGVGVVVTGPLLAAIAVALKLDSPGPVIFRQERVGLGGRPFVLFKFRTMRADAERALHAAPALYGHYVAGGYKLASGADPRVTGVGRVLRRLDLDELPQLYNVLWGHMALVGPRPVLAAELDERYGPLRCHYEAVRPGMTGLWQVSGRNRLPYAERVALDVDYVSRLSMARDLVILARTLGALLRGGGSPNPGPAETVGCQAGEAP